MTAAVITTGSILGVIGIVFSIRSIISSVEYYTRIRR